MIEQILSRKKQQPSTNSTKENRSIIHDEKNQHRHAPQSRTRPDVFERLGPILIPNMNAKIFKSDTSHNSELSHGWEGIGEMERSGYQSKHSQEYRAEHRAKDKSTDQVTHNGQHGGSGDRWRPIRATSQRFVSRKIVLYKQAIARVVFRPTSKINRTTTNNLK